MIDKIYEFFAIIFGYIMNGFYIALDFIGLPYLWLCIILFAVVTRLMFLPQRIRSTRKTLLAPAVNYEVNKIRKRYGSISKSDKEKLKQYRKDVEAVNKKYRVTTSSGCLALLLQFPILVGLFRVIKEPFRYVPRLSLLTGAERAQVNDFFGLSLESLPQAFGALGIIVPTIVLISSIIRILPNFKTKSARKNITLVIMNLLPVVLLTWMSFCFPIAISLYWVVKDLTNIIIKALVERSLNRNEKIKTILAKTAFYISEDKAREERERAQLANEAAAISTPSESFTSVSDSEENVSEAEDKA